LPRRPGETKEKRVTRRLIALIVVGAAVTALGARSLPAGAGIVRKIVYTKFAGGTVALYSVNPDGTNLVRLTPEDFWAQDHDVSPDGSKVVFANCPRRCDIFAVNIDGTGLTRLSSGSAIDSFPIWSRDGSRIAFSRAPSYDAGAALYVMSADGSQKLALTTHRWYNYLPSWSPDGSELVFVRWLRGDYEIYRGATDGSGITRLTSNQGNDQWPQWSPDGSRIVYSFADDSFQDYEIYSIAPDGSGKTRLTNNGFRDDMVPRWSPAGDRIAFIRCEGTTCHLYSMLSDGNNKVRLVEKRVESLSHAWSPDGLKLAMARLTLRNRFDIFTVNFDGSALTNLTNTRSRDEAAVDW
jgi:Tol biopolymer transport system component